MRYIGAYTSLYMYSTATKEFDELLFEYGLELDEDVRASQAAKRQPST